MQTVFLRFAFLAVLSVFSLLACGGGSSASDAATDPDDDAGAGDIIATDIFPTDLVVASPFAVSSGNPSLSAFTPRFAAMDEVDAASEDYETKQEALADQLTATSTDTCGFNLPLFASRGGALPTVTVPACNTRIILTPFPGRKTVTAAAAMPVSGTKPKTARPARWRRPIISSIR